MHCPKGCQPYAGAVPTIEGLTFVVGSSSRPPFDKIGTHGPRLETCGCGSPSHRDNGIEANGAWWRGLTRAQRLAALAHEHAHAMCGLDCEECSDRHGGFVMRAWGYTRPGIRAAYDATVKSHGRQGAGARAEEGAAAYDAQAKGLDAHREPDGDEAPPVYEGQWQSMSPNTGYLTGPRSRGLASAPARVTSTKAPPASSPAPVVAGRPIATPAFAPPSSRVAPASSAPPLSSASTVDPGGPGSSSFTPATIVDGSQDGAAFDVFGVKVDKGQIAAEVISGVVVALIVFVIFRYGASS